jgi:hypothetical protein
MGIFLNGCACDLVGTSVMPKMYHLATLALENPPKDSYRCVVTIENRCCGDDSDGHFPPEAVIGASVVPLPELLSTTFRKHDSTRMR